MAYKNVKSYIAERLLELTGTDKEYVSSDIYKKIEGCLEFKTNRSNGFYVWDMEKYFRLLPDILECYKSFFEKTENYDMLIKIRDRKINKK